MASGGARAALEAISIPLASAVAAAAALGYALAATRLDAESSPSIQSPERAAEAFATAYRTHAYDEAARLATGDLRRNLELRARSARLRGARDAPLATARGTQRFVIDESFMLARDRLRFTGSVADDDAPEAAGWPISITVIREGDSYLAQAVSWPKGPPPNDR